jgi:16S rRNA (cytosine1402-N4)-methyltransferase
VRHEPVLVAEVLAYLRGGPGLYLDATLGDGGHAHALLAAEPGARVLGCDRDTEALAFAGQRLKEFGSRVTVAHATFRELPGIVGRAGGELLAGALLDLGLSSRQIDDAERGMSFQASGPLDLRMDRTRGVPAAERLRTIEAHELEQVLRELGDVPDARRIARSIVEAAGAGRLESTKDLVLAIDRSGARAAVSSRHPRRYAQVFQALRMWVNDEAGELEAALAWLPEAMRPGGVVVTLAYHSGEDRKIKQALRGARIMRPVRRLPEIAGTRPPEGPWDEITHRVVTPSQAERDRNPRARSARLRAFRKKP